MSNTNCLKTREWNVVRVVLSASFNINFDCIKMSWFFQSFSQKCSKLTLDSIFRHPKIPKKYLQISFCMYFYLKLQRGWPIIERYDVD